MENTEVVFFDQDQSAIAIVPEGTPVEVTDEIAGHILYPKDPKAPKVHGVTFLTAADTRELIRKLSEAVDNVEAR